jgi:hypothetical protein
MDWPAAVTNDTRNGLNPVRHPSRTVDQKLV